MLTKRIKELRTFFKMTQYEIAEKLGISQPKYANYESRGSIPPIDILEKLSDLFNINLHWLITGTGEMLDTDRITEAIPLIDHHASAGNGITNHDRPETRTLIPVSSKLFYPHDPKDILAIEIFGDSMEINGSGFCHGDLVFFTTKVFRKGDGAYIIRLDGDLLLKRLQFTPGLITIISDNAKYKPIEIRQNSDNQIQFEIVGVVVGKLRLYR